MVASVQHTGMHVDILPSDFVARLFRHLAPGCECVQVERQRAMCLAQERMLCGQQL